MASVGHFSRCYEISPARERVLQRAFSIFIKVNRAANNTSSAAVILAYALNYARSARGILDLSVR